MISEPASRSYGENENLTLSEADLSAIGPTQTAAGGKKLRAYCPIHGSDHQRSLEVDLQSGRFHCHSCDAWGYLDWAREEYRRERGLERDARTSGSLQNRSRRPPVQRPAAPIPKLVEPVRQDLDELTTRFREALPGSWGEKYLEHRGIPLELAREYGVGYATPKEWPGRGWKGGRLAAPHTRPDGTIVNLYGRAVAKGEVPKQRKHDHLAGNKGYWNARVLREGEGPLYVAEGLLDALALIASGCERTVAIFSARDWRWHWLPDDVRQLVLAFDADDTGDEAREKLASEARLRGIEVAYLDAEAYGGENDPAAAYAAGKLVVGEWPEDAEPPPAADPASPLGDAAAEADREARDLLYRIYDAGGCVEIRADGEVYAGKPGGLADADRETFAEHGEAIKYLLSAEAMSELWSRAIRHILSTAEEYGYTSGTAEYERASELIAEAQDAYEAEDNGLCRYRLRQTALAAAGRL